MRIALVAVAAVAAIVAAAAPAGAEAAGAWRHGIIEAKSDAGIFLMVTHGFAEKQGVKLDISQFKSDAVGLKALIAGEVDSYEGALTGTLVAASHGVDVRLLGCHWPGLPHGIFVRGAINAVPDLKGKIIAISSPFSLPDVLAAAVLAKYGVPSAEVRFVNMGADVDRYKALVAGLVDATVISGEYAPLAAKAGVKLLIPGRDVLPEYMRVCLWTTGKALAAHRDEAIRFVAAEMAALRYALSHRDETLALTRKITGAKPDDPRPAYIYDDAVRSRSVDPDVAIPMSKILWMEDLLVKQGNLTHPLDPTSFIEPEIRATALARLGK